MFRTSRTARRGRAALTWMGEWRLPGPERHAARSARDVERQCSAREARGKRKQSENSVRTRRTTPAPGPGGM